MANNVVRPGDMWIASPAYETSIPKHLFFIYNNRSATRLAHQEATGVQGAKYAGLRPVVCLKERS